MTVTLNLVVSLCQKKTAILEWRGLANFLGLVKESSANNFIQTAKAFDNQKTFNTSVYKEYGNLDANYWEQFVAWITSGESEITVGTINQKLKLLRRHQYVTTHVMCQENTFIHPMRSMIFLSPISVKHFLF